MKILYPITLLVASTLSAAPLFEESFNYSTGSLSGTGGWTSGTASVVASDIGSVNPNNSGANAGFVGSGSNILNSGLTTSTGVDYYFSYSLSTSNAATTNAINGLHFQTTDGLTTNASVAGISDGFFGVSTEASNNEAGFTSSGVAVSANTDYFVVGVIRTNDNGSNYGYNISASIFKAGDTLPTSVPTWQIDGAQRSISKTGRAPFQGIYMLTRGANTTFDDIRVSTTFADVSPIPEPSSYALLAGSLAIGLIAMSRKR